jgi:PIN domain nuclease of toxin-antitoxin system
VIVLDASALLAYLFREPGHEQVAPHMDAACLSAINLAEVILRFVRDGHDAQIVLARLQGAVTEVVPFLAEDAALSAALEPVTRSQGLSLGDRACLALALTRSLPAVTADSVWAKLDLPVKVRIIR